MKQKFIQVTKYLSLREALKTSAEWHGTEIYLCTKLLKKAQFDIQIRYALLRCVQEGESTENAIVRSIDTVIPIDTSGLKS